MTFVPRRWKAGRSKLGTLDPDLGKQAQAAEGRAGRRAGGGAPPASACECVSCSSAGGGHCHFPHQLQLLRAPALSNSAAAGTVRWRHACRRQSQSPSAPAVLLPPLRGRQVGPVLGGTLLAHPAAASGSAAGWLGWLAQPTGLHRLLPPPAATACLGRSRLCAGLGAALARGSDRVGCPKRPGRAPGRWPAGKRANTRQTGGQVRGGPFCRVTANPGDCQRLQSVLKCEMALAPEQSPKCRSPGPMQRPKGRPAPAPASSPGHWRVSVRRMAGSGLHWCAIAAPLTACAARAAAVLRTVATMFTARKKIVKEGGAEPSELEEQVAQVRAAGRGTAAGRWAHRELRHAGRRGPRRRGPAAAHACWPSLRPPGGPAASGERSATRCGGMRVAAGQLGAAAAGRRPPLPGQAAQRQHWGGAAAAVGAAASFSRWHSCCAAVAWRCSSC